MKKYHIRTDTGAMAELKPGSKWVGVSEGIGGWFAVIWWLNNEDFAPEVFPEPWDTGLGRYATKEEAYVEAKLLAADGELPLEHP